MAKLINFPSQRISGAISAPVNSCATVIKFVPRPPTLTQRIRESRPLPTYRKSANGQ